MVSEVCAVEEEANTSIGIVLHIDCLFVSCSVWRACGNCFPSQLNPICDFSIGARDPLYNGKSIVDDVPAGCVRSALATVSLDPQVQHMAQATIAYGRPHPDLLRLARLGSNGVLPKKLSSRFT